MGRPGKQSSRLARRERGEVLYWRIGVPGGVFLHNGSVLRRWLVVGVSCCQVGCASGCLLLRDEAEALFIPSLIDIFIALILQFVILRHRSSLY